LAKAVTAKTTNRLTLVIALAMFVAAIFVLYYELANTRLADVLDYAKAMPKTRMLGAVGLTATSYVLLSGYDFLALHYARKLLRLKQVLFASFVAFALSNNLGFALVSGGSARYRIYSGYGLTPVEIGEVVAFCTLSYALGVTTVGGLMFILKPVSLASILRLPWQLVQAIGMMLLVATVIYLAVVATLSKPISLGSYRLRLPSIEQGLAQTALASVDQAIASAVLYVLLPPSAAIDFATFLGIYVIAAPLSLLSLVPGGLGVFETALLVMLADTPKAASLASLVTYRFIYFLIPLVLAVAWEAIYEMRRASKWGREVGN
jgi:uncharacterized membrane protein YbhN (UPF0104 family)